MILLCALTVLPWIGLGEFSTKGEPREAAVAISMMETGNYILPKTYAEEFAYKPPMAHWLMAVFSLPQGHVSEFTARLPSALAFITMIGFILGFFGKRIEKFQIPIIAAFLLITCIEIHRAAMTTRVDMLLTSFMVIGLIQLFRWEEMLELKGLPIAIPILLGCAVLTKGPVGLILPLFVFFVYLLILGKYRFWRIVKALFYITISSLFLPMIWYVAAWQQGGEDFLEVVLAENFGRFFSMDTPDIHYELGHERPIYYNFTTLIAGFIPWTFIVFFSLFGLKIRKPEKSFKQILADCWQKIRSMEKVYLFSLAVVVCVLFFYSIPASKRSVYLMPAYPFIALFLAQYILYLAEYRTKVTRIFAAFMASVTAIALVALLLTAFGVIDPVALTARFTPRTDIHHTVSTIAGLFTSPDLLTIVILLSVATSLGVVCYQMFRKINLKILYATIGLMICIHFMIDGIIMRGERMSNSSRPFAEKIMNEFPLNKKNIYVTNDLREYTNLYGMNFYMGNIFHNFETVQPGAGYFLSTESDLKKIELKYGDTYVFQPLAITPDRNKEVRRKIVLSSFERR
nr:dolichyl-phosphate-mannose--protein mannosyltransferase [Parabacteroides sp. PF5-6]